MDVLKAAIDAANKSNISTIVVASTSGNTALRLLGFTNKAQRLRIIVVTHDEGRPPGQKRFNEDIRRQLLASNITVYTHDPRRILLRKITAKLLGRFGFPRWYRHLEKIKQEYGTGIKVCHIILQMLIESRVLRDGRVIALAGKKSGADSAGIFLVKPQNNWPVLERVILKPDVTGG